ncbi:uncharacterized protein LOC6547276 [Drosophila erecta]|uniref:Uncharacterized protein n=1 Tax=Drosophila erecta TaxID=7220 RepID=B3NSJ7_DROER|nr:uncharacterized protein LOC6547276 [Drosophila erecta]EDV56499.1 uncharacterized protein Dere_GG20187 [Drosophila erecta]
MQVLGGPPLSLCLLLIITPSLIAANPLWSLDQVGAYLSGIFRSVVGPIFGFGLAANSTAL